MTPPLIADTATATPPPWNCASRYSSIVGVPIISQSGQRIGNTAVPDMPAVWDHLKRQAEVNAAFICEAVNAHASLKARVAELEANERAYEAALGQRTYNEVALHIKKLTEALRPFADFADPRNTIPPDTILTAGSPLARKQITMADCYAAARALTNGDAS